MQKQEKAVTSSSCNALESNKKRVDRLFTRIAVFYGHLWRSQFKNEGFLEFAKKEWLAGLRAFNDEILNLAIIECRDFFEMPPSLPQVIGICRGIKKRKNFFVAPKELSSVSKKTGSNYLQKCKAILKTQGLRNA